MSSVKPTWPPFLRFNAATGWPLGPPESRPGIPDSDGPLMLAIAGSSPISLSEPFGSFGGRTLPRGLAISGDGRLFLADPERHVILTALAGALPEEPPADADPLWPFVPLWPARPLPPEPGPHDLAEPPAWLPDTYTLSRPTDVAIAPNGDLVIADPGARRLLVIAFPTAQLRHVITIPAGRPSAIAFDGHGRAYVADPERVTVHRFDRNWRRDEAYPHPATLFTAPEYIAATASEPGSVCTCGCGGERPSHAAAVYVLDAKDLVALDERGRAEKVGDAKGVVLTPPTLQRSEDGALLYADPARSGYRPIRIPALSLTRDGRHVGSGLALIATPRRILVPRSGQFVTVALDGGRPGFAWDRITFDATVPENARLLVQTLTNDSLIEFDRLDVLPAEAWSRPLPIEHGEEPEILVQSVAGRYLWLSVELFGDGSATPAIAGIDIYGPRRSAMRHLPASYHQDPESVRFLDRFLSYFDVVFAEITAQNRDVAALFDSEAAPEGVFLNWLGSWFDLEFLAEWDTATRRQMIAEAISYYRQRGTVAGLKRILQWHLGLADPMPQVIEHFRVPAGQVFPIGGTPLELEPAVHSATVVLPASSVADAEAEARLSRLIAASVPAHVRIHLRLIEAEIAIGFQSTVGVDTLLGGLAPQGLGSAKLGQDLRTAGPAALGTLANQSNRFQRSQSC